MPRFVLLEHDYPVLHWDLLLECGEACRTWRLSAPPGECGDIRAEALPNHRRMYLDYEGPVSGDRGTVKRWDAGTFVWLTATDAKVMVLLAGSRCAGRWELIQNGEGWRMFSLPGKSKRTGISGPQPTCFSTSP
jgi:hypothetical protein